MVQNKFAQIEFWYAKNANEHMSILRIKTSTLFLGTYLNHVGPYCIFEPPGLVPSTDFHITGNHACTSC